MMPTRRIILATVLCTVLGSAASFASAATDPSSDTNGASSTDQVHRQRDPFTDGANNSARDPYLDGAHLPSQA
jgi:hypothetical protein